METGCQDGAVAPLALFPGETFIAFPYAPTLEGQYIIKNVVLIGAAMVIGSTVRGGRVVPEPAAAADSAEGANRPPRAVDDPEVLAAAALHAA